MSWLSKIFGHRHVVVSRDGKHWRKYKIIGETDEYYQVPELTGTEGEQLIVLNIYKNDPDIIAVLEKGQEFEGPVTR